MKKLLLMLVVVLTASYGISQPGGTPVYGPVSAINQTVSHDATSHAPIGTVQVKLIVQYETFSGTYTAVSSPQSVDPGQSTNLTVTISGTFSVLSKKIVVNMPGGSSTWDYYNAGSGYSFMHFETAPYPTAWYDESYIDTGEAYLDDITFWNEYPFSSGPLYFKIEGHF